MKILVALKQVPARDSLLKVDSSGRRLDESGLTFEINEPDAYALEAALQLKEKQGGEVVVLCAGPERAGASIREALAKGADRAIHIEVPDPDLYDPLGMARLLAKAAVMEGPDLVLAGLQSDDCGSGQTGVILAELLGLPHVTLVIEIEAAGDRLRVKRELEGGWFQHVELPLPAVLTVQSGISRLRYATLMGIKKAKLKEVRRLALKELAAAVELQVHIEALTVPMRTKQTAMITGTPQEQAAALVEKLRFEARVL